MSAESWALQLLFIFSMGPKAEALVKNIDNYGPYKVNCDYFEYCAGPKSRNVSIYNIEMMKDGDDCVLQVNLTFLAQSYIDEIKVIVYTVKEKRKTNLWNYKLNDPCNHYAVANMVERYLNATKCMIKKGNYFVNVNISEATRLFFGTSFFYGEYLIKANIVSKQGNILCFLLNNIYTKNKQ